MSEVKRSLISLKLSATQLGGEQSRMKRGSLGSRGTEPSSVYLSEFIHLKEYIYPDTSNAEAGD